MAGTRAGLAAELASSGRFNELKQRLLFVLGALIVYRIGSFIPVPGINAATFAQFFDQQQGTILSLFNMFSGGALKRFTVFALGVMPYISASIIMQLLTAVIPTLEQLKKEGESGRRKITQYTRYFTVVLATFQAGGVALALQQTTAQGGPVVAHPGMGFIFSCVVTLVCGTMFLMWLGEQVTERGIGNGISMIIFAGIVAGLPPALGGTLSMVNEGSLSKALVLILIILAVVVTGFVVFMERGQRRITINYAKRQQGRRVYAGQSSFLPLKVNMAGVIPPIFASSIILFPSTLASWFAQSGGWLADISTTLQPGTPIYTTIYAVMIVFFCFFYTALVYNPRETADNLKRSGAFIQGVRPGEQTAKYIDRVMTRLTLIGAVYITGVCLIPELLIVNFRVPFYFGGTSLLIIVVVVMDFMAQLQAHLMSHQYEGLLKKSGLR